VSQPVLPVGTAGPGLSALPVPSRRV